MTNKLKDAIQDLITENYASNLKHGEWEGYSPFHIHKAVADEFREFSTAVINEDIHSRHGMRAELLQLANVALKGYMRLEGL